MKEALVLKPVEMTGKLMQDLEEKGLILRLRPRGHELSPGPDETKVEVLYKSAVEYGTHQVITVTVNRFEPAYFGTHPDNEDVLLVGDPETKPMWFIIAKCKAEELQEKIEGGRLSPDDFVVFRSRFNDPEVSFFTMLKGTPHGECTIDGDGKPPSFYVTEPTDMPLDITDFCGYALKVIA
jgi:hypothetical protein